MPTTLKCVHILKKYSDNEKRVLCDNTLTHMKLVYIENEKHISPSQQR